MSTRSPTRLTVEELQAECGALLPAREVLSVPLLDLNLDLDLALALAAPIDLAVAGNLNVAAPIDAAVSANVVSPLSTAASAAHQAVQIDQVVSGEATANGDQTSSISQPDTADVAVPQQVEPPDVPTALLNLDADIAIDADLAAPIAGAVALNANVAAPIDAAVSANIGSIGSQAVAVADQTAVITQQLNGVVAEATVEQDSEIDQ